MVKLADQIQTAEIGAACLGSLVGKDDHDLIRQAGILANLYRIAAM
jgi:hypothetical protein